MLNFGGVAPENGWLEDDPLAPFLAKGLLSGAFAVSFREGNSHSFSKVHTRICLHKSSSDGFRFFLLMTISPVNKLIGEIHFASI